MHRVQYRPLSKARAGIDPVMIHAVPTQHLIYAYVDLAQIDEVLLPELDALGEELTAPYEWRDDGPSANPAVELRIHRVREVPGSRLVSVDLEPGLIHLSIPRDLIKVDLSRAIAAHSTQMMRLMH